MATETETPNPTPAVTHLLGLIRCLLDFGRRLASDLRQGADAVPDFRDRASLFATTDVATILLRIARGLRLAAALEALLLQRAARGRDIKEVPVRMYEPRPRAAASRRRRERRAPLPLEPTDEEIAAEVRRRPAGAIIVEIYLDLGLLPRDFGRDGHRQLMDAVMDYGGSPLRLMRFDEDMREAREHMAILRSGAPLPPELQPFPMPAALGTGPP